MIACNIPSNRESSGSTHWTAEGHETCHDTKQNKVFVPRGYLAVALHETGYAQAAPTDASGYKSQALCS